jgi:predicted DNA-binding ribbon-helix-helix protein
MEQVMWNSLTDICRTEDRTINEVISMIDEKRADSNLTAAIRVFIICYYRDVAHRTGMSRSGFSEAPSFDVDAIDPDDARPLDPSPLLSAALGTIGDSRVRGR